MNHVIIVGGGASGLMAAIMAARKKHRVTILEHKEKPGKKILATGNGKCNYTNLVQRPDCYRGGDASFALKVINQFNVDKTLEFFLDLGVYPKVRNGYVYPNSEQAASVAESLLLEAKLLNINIQCDVHVEKIKINTDGFLIHTTKGNYTANKVILAAGGCASPGHGSDGSGFALAKMLGHTVIKPLPALVQLKSGEKYFKTLAGVRAEGAIKLVGNYSILAEEKGEILLAAYGVSGIPVMQVSRFAAKALEEKQKVDLLIDFLPQLNQSELLELLRTRMQRNKEKTIEQVFIGLLNNKLVYVCLNQIGIKPEQSCNEVKQKQLQAIAKQLKEWRVPINGTNSFEQAQVSAGGVAVTEINPHTMESKLVKGLYFTGEIVDVDGTCGGYNLQWAWSSGAVAGLQV
jgi:predicted Rossmann fold flavoprotein